MEYLGGISRIGGNFVVLFGVVWRGRLDFMKGTWRVPGGVSSPSPLKTISVPTTSGVDGSLAFAGAPPPTFSIDTVRETDGGAS